MKNRLGVFSIALLAAVTTSTAAHAHGGTGISAGFLHPLSGLDHLLALVAVGIWAGRAGGRAAWAVPATFLVFLATGALLVLAGVAIPGVETAIFASVAILAALAAVATRLTVVGAAGISGVFALFHGAAHAATVGGAAGSFIAGWLAASVLVIAFGIALGGAIERARGRGIAIRS